MNVFVVYAHPSHDSFTYHVLETFLRGLDDAGHSYVVSDLYAMGFKTDISEAEYLREANYRLDPVSADVRAEQEKINSSDAIVFIYPLFWTDVPAKLKGWFDRVWTYGFAYGERSMKKLDKALVLCTSGHTLEKLQEFGHLESINTVMLGDRVFTRAKEKKLAILDEMSKYDMEARKRHWDAHLSTVYEEALNL